MRHLWSSAIIFLFMVAPLTICPPGARAQERWFAANHGSLSFSFLHTGAVVAERQWPLEISPQKFSMEIVLNQGGADMIIMLFPLGDRTGDWWLAEVMGFLFVPEVSVQAQLTQQGYESYVLNIPGGHGVDQQTEMLIVMPGAGVRITCLKCQDAEASEHLSRLADSLISDLDHGASKQESP